MKIYKIAVIAGAAMFAATSFTQGGITLRRQLVEGDLDTYLVEIKSSQIMYSDMMGQEFPIDVITTAKVAMKVGKVDEEKQEADVDITGTDLKYDFGSIGGMMGDVDSQMPKEFSFKGKMNKFGEITGAMAAPATGGRGGMMGGMMMMLGGGASGAGTMFPSLRFPEAPLNIGDSWDIPVPANAMTGTPDQKMNAQLVSQRDVDGVLIYVVAIKASTPMNIDMARMMEAQGGGGNDMAGMMADMKITGAMETSATVWVEQGTGRIVKHETLQKSKQKIDGGMFQADINGTTTIKMTRVKN